MRMIRAMIRNEKYETVQKALLEKGFPQMTKLEVVGRGRQKGLRVGSVFFDELPKTMIMIVSKDEDVQDIVDIICDNAKTGEDGNYGDGRIFISEVIEAYTISNKTKEL